MKRNETGGIKRNPEYHKETCENATKLAERYVNSAEMVASALKQVEARGDASKMRESYRGNWETRRNAPTRLEARRRPLGQTLRNG